MKILFLQERFLILIVNHLKDDNIRELRENCFYDDVTFFD